MDVIGTCFANWRKIGKMKSKDFRKKELFGYLGGRDIDSSDSNSLGE